MNKYSDLLQRMISENRTLDEEGRRALYDRAVEVLRNTLNNKFDSSIVERELAQLREAIEVIEAQHAAGLESLPADIVESADPDDLAIASGVGQSSSEPSRDEQVDEDYEFSPEEETAVAESVEEAGRPDSVIAEELERANARPSLLLLFAALAVAVVTGIYVYTAPPPGYAVTTQVTRVNEAAASLPEGLSAREAIGSTGWSFGGMESTTSWWLETRSPKSVDFILARKVLSGRVEFPEQGLGFRVVFGLLRAAGVKQSYFLDVQIRDIKVDGPAVMKMFMPRLRIKVGEPPAELNGVVIRSGANGFLANLSTTDKEHAVNEVLLKSARTIEFPFLLDSGERRSLEIRLPENALALVAEPK